MASLKDVYVNADPQEAAAIRLADIGYVNPDQTEINAMQSEMNAASTDQGAELLDQKKALEEKMYPPPTPITEETPEPTKTPAQGLTFQEAIELFGQDFTGVHRNEDGTYTPDTTALARVGAKTTTEKTPEQLQFDKDKAVYDDAKARLQNFSADMENDPTLQRTLAGVSSTWDARIRQQEQSNASRVAAMQTAGFRYGSLRYGGGNLGPMASIISAEERAGLELISELNAKKNESLAAARSAYEKNKWDQYAKLVDLADDAYSESKKAVAALVKTQAEEEKKRKEKEIQSSRDLAVADLFNQGIDDPGALLDLLNLDENGKQVGDFTAEEIDKVLKVLKPDQKLSGLSADYQTFKYLQKQKDPTVDGLNYFEFLDAVNNAKRANNPTIKEFVVGGRRIRQTLDPSTGQVIDETDLGDAGEAGAGGGGVFTKEEKARLSAAGVPPDVGENITKLLINGTALEKIREGLKEAGLDPAILDRYDRAVGIEQVRGIPGTKNTLSDLAARIEAIASAPSK